MYYVHQNESLPVLRVRTVHNNIMTNFQRLNVCIWSKTYIHYLLVNRLNVYVYVYV